MPRGLDPIGAQLKTEHDPGIRILHTPPKRTPPTPEQILQQWAESWQTIGIPAIKNVTGLDFASPEALIVSLGELIVSGISLPDLSKMFGFVDIPETLEQLSSWLRPHLFGQIPAWRLGNIPAAHIGNFNPELLDDPGFDFASTIADNPAYTWDGTVGRGGTPIGSAHTTADGTTRVLRSNRFEVSAGQKLSVKAYAFWEGLTYTAGAGGPIRLSVTLYNGDTITGSYVVSSVSPASTDAADWVMLAGEYQIASGATVTHAAVMLSVGSEATAGGVWFDDGSARKVGLISQALVNGLQAALQDAADRWQALVDGAWQAITGGTGTNKLLDDLKAALQAIPQGNIQNLPAALEAAGGAIADAIVHAMGGTGTGHDAGDVLTALLNIPQNLVHGLEDELADLGDAAADVHDDVRATWRKFLSALTGNDEDAGATAQKNADQLAAVVANLAAAAASVSALETNLNQANGVHGGDLFERDNPTGIDPGWSVSNGQPASTHGTYIAANGQAQWDKHASAPSPQTTICVRTDPADAKTVSLYQVITRTIGTQVRHSRCRDYIFGRVSDDRLSYVYADFWTDENDGINYRYYVQIKYVTNGVAGSLGSPVLLAQAESVAMRHSLVCGTGGGLRVFRVLRNGIPVLTVTDTGNVTNVASDCRGWGFGGQTGTYLGSQVAPSAVTGISVDDDDPSAITGTTFRAYRANTAYSADAPQTPVTGTGGPLPNNVFDTVDYITSDLVWNATTSELLVTKSATYAISARYDMGSGAGWVEIFLNGVLSISLGGQPDAGIGSRISALHGSTTKYLAAGTVIRFGILINTAGGVKGSADGRKSWVAVARMG
ncbi:minor tail protein [Mycobacterium phage MalagasyRose]|uniref:Minor tail protein n=1 Tax=Mycobacterium phage MalagasyRose TaxID=2599870 RepID=A0A5J6TGB9_9CAUD|nr:minor tail protein [Mycobacterium phage MalagasyRose]QFG08877.1 minor tail protein [Mycobacterium phage MalagasyRose]